MSFENVFSVAEQTRIQAEFQRTNDIHYLDHAGASLYSEEQLSDVTRTLQSKLFCNPHTSKSTEDIIDQMRFSILNHFNTDASQYSVVFTSGATASLKLVAECFDFWGDPANRVNNECGNFAYCQDNHTSVLGMRAIVRTENIRCVDRPHLIDVANQLDSSYGTRSLLVYAAQCNFNGYRQQLITHEHHSMSSSSKNVDWFVCLDAASLVASSSLDLAIAKPDYVCISFYKMFGYPTGLGALLVSKRGETALEKRYYGGGTVKIAMSLKNFHHKRDIFHECFEDGTVSFLSIISLASGFKMIQRLCAGGVDRMTRISDYTFKLSQFLYGELAKLKYSNGQRLVAFYQDTDFSDAATQGPILNFNILHADGSFVGFAEIACMASLHNIHLRTGCFCNPGTCQRLLKLTNAQLEEHYKAGHICGDSNDLINGTPTGSVRISVGFMTTRANVEALIMLLKRCYLKTHLELMTTTVTLNGSQHFVSPRTPQPSADIRLQQICVYPIKSCGPIRNIDKWPLTRKGLKYDREWMIVNANGAAITQKMDTRLCLIRPEIDETANVMTLHFPDVPSFRLGINDEQTQHRLFDASICQSKVCGDRVRGLDCGDEVAAWLSDTLTVDGLRLFRQMADEKRFQKARGRRVGDGLPQVPHSKEITLNNQNQLLLINRTSVRWLAEKVDDWMYDGQLTEDIDGVIERFRGNLIIETAEPLDEMHWQQIAIGNFVFTCDGPCTRCQMICIDQRTGDKTYEPLRTIAREFNGKLRFGMYLSFSLDDKCAGDELVVNTVAHAMPHQQAA